MYSYCWLVVLQDGISVAVGSGEELIQLEVGFANEDAVPSEPA